MFQAPECNICLSELTEDLSTSTCGHVFHSTCINQCQKSKILDCPICRATLMIIPLKNLKYSKPKNHSFTSFDDSRKHLNLLFEDNWLYQNEMNARIDHIKYKSDFEIRKLKEDIFIKENDLKNLKTRIDDLNQKVASLETKIQVETKFADDYKRMFLRKFENFKRVHTQKKRSLKLLLKASEEKNQGLQEELHKLREVLKNAQFKNSELIKENSKIYETKNDYNKSLEGNNKKKYQNLDECFLLKKEMKSSGVRKIN